MATAKAKAPADAGEIYIHELVRGKVEVCILGTSPLIMNRLNQKAKEELLFPKGRKTAADKAAGLKHDPDSEYRASPYRMPNPDAPTLMAFLPTAIKKGMGTAALETPGAKKAQIGRLVSVDYDRQPLYGTPKLLMSVVRSADMNKTPDIRTRSIFPEWACKMTITFIKPTLREQSIANLLGAAGVVSGMGDYRQEKGAGSFGSFAIVSENDPDFVRILATQGRAAQQDAMDNPECYDDETADLYEWFNVEVKRRGFKLAA